jgi:hypothetical protein
MLVPGSIFPLFRTFRPRVNLREKKKVQNESADSAQNDSFIPQKFGQSLSALWQVRKTK